MTRSRTAEPRAWLVVLVAAIAACSSSGSADARARDPAAHRTSRGSGPRRGPRGLRPEVETQALGDGGTYRLHRWSFALADVDLDIVDLAMTTPLDTALRSARATLVFNAGFFLVDGTPDGLSLARGHAITPPRSGMSGGVLTISGHVAALHGSETFVLAPGIDFGVQCRPRLVVDGHVNIRSDDGRRADRTALCARDRGRRLDVYVARTDHPTGMGGPTLFSFATLLQSRGCENALNLDGGPSTGIAWQQDMSVRVLPPRGPVRQAIAVTLRR